MIRGCSGRCIGKRSTVHSMKFAYTLNAGSRCLARGLAWRATAMAAASTTPARVAVRAICFLAEKPAGIFSALLMIQGSTADVILLSPSAAGDRPPADLSVVKTRPGGGGVYSYNEEDCEHEADDIRVLAAAPGGGNRKYRRGVR